MKKLKNWKNACMLAGIFIFASCTSHSFHTVTIALDDACTPEQQILASEVINNRIASIWRVREKSDLTDGKFNITHSGENALLERMLTQRGEVYITEMFETHEVQSALIQVNERLLWFMRNTDPELNWLLGVHPVLITAPSQHIAFIDSIFNQLKHFFPANTYFVWSAKPDVFNGFYELFALNTARPIPLNPNTIRSSRIQDNIHGFQQVSINFNRDYHDEWAQMTRENIGGSIAIVMDGKVLSHPRVVSEITGGATVISGDFEMDDLLLIKSVIMGGVLDCKARIVNE